MPADSPRRGSAVLQVLVAMLFLAVIGGSAGFLAAHRQKQRQAAAHVTQPAGATASAGSPAPSASGVECPAHTEALAAVGTLRQLLYVHTVSSEVWICQDAQGRLYYQGHLGAPGEELHEGVNALFLRTIMREGTAGYVATNVDPKTGQVTKYHVTPEALRRERVGHPPETYESALPN